MNSKLCYDLNYYQIAATIFNSEGMDYKTQHDVI